MSENDHGLSRHGDSGSPINGTVAASSTAVFAGEFVRIGILSHPNGGASATPPLMNLITVVRPVAGELAIVTGAESCAALLSQPDSHPAMKLFPVQGLFPTWAKRTGLYRRLINFVLTQCRAAVQVGRVRRHVDLWIFYIDGQNQLLPMLVARLFGRPVLLLMAYSAVETLKRTNPAMATGARALSSFGCSLSDCIAVASADFIDDWSLGRWRDKVRVAHEHYIDLGGLLVGPPVGERSPRIGYVGRFAAEKGIMEFLEAARLLHARDPTLQFLVVGDGPLRKAVDEAVRLNGLRDCLIMTGWIPGDTVRDYVRELKLLVVPSYTESGPMVAYEALALGTPILITRTGLVAGMIEEGVTGFLLEDPSPASIVEGVMRALATPSLDQVSVAGRCLVSRELSLDRTRSRLIHVLLDVVHGPGNPVTANRELLSDPGERTRGG